MTDSFLTFLKDAPCAFCPRETCEPEQQGYKYYLCGKGCTLGVLFEDTLNVHFEWLTENGRRVEYAPHLRYRSWPKREVARLMSEGVWEPASVPAV